MIKVFDKQSIKNIEQDYMLEKSVSEIDLIDRAGRAIADVFMKRYDKSRRVYVFAGAGNNGADALAMSNILYSNGYEVKVFLINPKGCLSDGCSYYYDELKKCDSISLEEIVSSFNPLKLTVDDVVVDGIFGIGLNRALSGGYAAIVNYINNTDAEVVSIDIPSGLMSESNSSNVYNNIVRATITIAIEYPKVCFFFAENQRYIGELLLVDIGLSECLKSVYKPCFSLVQRDDVKRLLRKRLPFSHKGNYGYGLIVGGSKGMAGAVSLSSKACVRSGIGVLTVCTPECNRDIVQMYVPEAVVECCDNESIVTNAPSYSRYSAVGIGVGLRTYRETADFVLNYVANCHLPMVVDADAINILSEEAGVILDRDINAILTPHIKEFERIVGEYSDGYDRLQKAIDIAVEGNKVIVLKGAYTAIAMPNGECFINTTGNAGMATGGTGDVLTGILLSLLAQGYSREDATIIGVYVHGLAGDIAKEKVGEISLIASDVIDGLPEAWKSIYE